MLKRLAIATLLCALGPGLAPDLASGGEITPDRAAQLEHLVRQDCGSCHGMALTGGLGTPLTAERLHGLGHESLAQIILDGVPGTAMPPWRPLLSEGEALWIAQYLLTAAE